jgi:hypothetical protein
MSLLVEVKTEVLEIGVVLDQLLLSGLEQLQLLSIRVKLKTRCIYIMYLIHETRYTMACGRTQ